MPVAEILAGIALVKSSVDFIKSNIDTCKDISEIGSAIDGLLRGKDEVNKKQGKRGPSDVEVAQPRKNSPKFQLNIERSV